MTTKNEKTLHLGFEVGTGKPVAIPIGHMAVTGQTQASGKTTTLEALVMRAAEQGVNSIAFVTKRGEGAFRNARPTVPYFRERADWQFVDQLLSAVLKEKNKVLRPQLMKVTRNTKTLAEVHAAVKVDLAKARGFNHGIYTQIDAYLDLIVPQLGKLHFPKEFKLWPGATMLDVSMHDTPIQMLFVQSALDWINERTSNTIVVVPEAWEFIPEGKGSPVKSSAETLVRKGAALPNYIWVDSQDMAGVDKLILRGCHVWLIGVQREANEIKRSLANIPASVRKPKAGDVATLERGQFFACYGSECVKTYVQPAWMTPDNAHRVAMGRPTTANRPIPIPVATPAPEEPTVTPTEANELREENARLKRTIEDLQRQMESLTSRVPAVAADGGPPVPPHVLPPKPSLASASYSELPPVDDDLYQAIKRRLAAEAPAIIQVLALKPEIRVEVERKTITMRDDELSGRIAILISQGFFSEGKGATVIARELARRGWTHDYRNVDKACARIAEQGFLFREGNGYVVNPSMTVNIVDKAA